MSCKGKRPSHAFLLLWGALVGNTYLLPSACIAMQKAETQRVSSASAARKISDAAFKKYTQYKITNFHCRLLEENAREFLFSYDDLDIVPRPGSEFYVTVSKATGEVTINRGK